MDDKRIISLKSKFFEKLIEHRFIADIMAHAWFTYKKEVKIIRCEVDSSGYDLILDCESIFRYIQLKTSITTSKRSYQKFNISLLTQENPCIIWIIYRYDKKKNDLDFKYYFWGTELGKRKPKESAYKSTRQKTPGGKRGRLCNVRNIPKGQFSEANIFELFIKLFGLMDEPDEPEPKRRVRAAV